MVKGLDTFQKYFADYEEQYVLIGGAACDILFESNEVMLMYGREAQSKTRIASPATIPKSGERNRKIHSCMLYLISI